MDSKKDDAEDRPEGEGGSAPRARNRTVMLTPEMTGQLRSRIGREGLVTSRDAAAEHPNPSPDGEPESPTVEEPTAFRPMHVHTPKTVPFTLPEEEEPVQPSAPSAVQFQQPSSFKPVAHPVPPDVRQETRPESRVYWSKQAPVQGFLVSYDTDQNGEVFELRQGRMIVTSERAAHGDYLVIADESISPMHAILRITGAGEVQVLDQLSEFGTKIKRLGSDTFEDLSGERSPVGHGDVIYFGKRSFHVCMVVREQG